MSAQMFTAYDKIPHGLYGLYQQYAEMTPGDDARMVAQDIAGSALKGDIVRILNDEMRVIKWNLKIVAEEFRLFALRDATGDAFDVYLLDEDGLFRGCATGVAEDDVVTTGVRLMNASASY